MLIFAEDLWSRGITSTIMLSCFSARVILGGVLCVPLCSDINELA